MKTKKIHKSEKKLYKNKKNFTKLKKKLNQIEKKLDKNSKKPLKKNKKKTLYKQGIVLFFSIKEFSSHRDSKDSCDDVTRTNHVIERVILYCNLI